MVSPYWRPGESASTHCRCGIGFSFGRRSIFRNPPLRKNRGPFMRRRMLGAVLPLVLVAAGAAALPAAAANWAIGYDDQATAAGAATITDAVGAGQAFQPGSLHAPPGGTPSWSTDGSTFTGTEPASGVTAVRASIPDAGPDATSLSASLTPPVQAVTTATGGDGFTPILYRTPGGTFQAWNIYHHLGATSPKVVCTG